MFCTYRACGFVWYVAALDAEDTSVCMHTSKWRFCCRSDISMFQRICSHLSAYMFYISYRNLTSGDFVTTCAVSANIWMISSHRVRVQSECQIKTALHTQGFGVEFRLFCAVMLECSPPVCPAGISRKPTTPTPCSWARIACGTMLGTTTCTAWRRTSPMGNWCRWMREGTPFRRKSWTPSPWR